MKVRFGLRKKFLIIYLIFTIMLAYGLNRMVSSSYDMVADKQYLEKALGIGKLAASILDGELIEEYAKTLQVDSTYFSIKSELDNIKLQTDTYYLYVIYLLSDTEGIYIFDAKLTEEQEKENGMGANPIGTYESLAEDFSKLPNVLQSKEASTTLDITTTYTGQKEETLGTIYVPIKNSEQDVIAFVGVDVSMSAVKASIKAAKETIVTMILIFCVVSFLILMLVVHVSVIKPIRILVRHADEMINGQFGHEIMVKGRDEISEISKVFNRMNRSIGNHLHEMQVINEAYYKFVPSKIFELLHKKVITDVELGSHVSLKLSILSYGISNFNDIIKKLDTEKMFLFINTCLNQAIPPVIKNEGVIEHFGEGGFTAFYVEQCERNLLSAISISEKIQAANKREEFGISEEVRIGIGIAYGQVMLGIVGHKERMSAISVAEYTTMAEYLGKISAKYYANIIITKAAIDMIPEFETRYHSRFLGLLYNSYSKRIEKLYDVYDGDNEEMKHQKTQTKEAFERGVQLFCAKSFTEARIAFVTVLKQAPKDTAAREYLYQCNQYYQITDTSGIDGYIEVY